MHTRVAPIVLAVQSSGVVHHARDHINIPEYISGVYGSLERGCDKRRVTDRLPRVTIVSQYLTIIPCAGTIVMINVGLAQARPNYILIALV